MSASGAETVVSVTRGQTLRPSCVFQPRDSATAFSVGSAGDWVVVAPGVAPVHLLLAFHAGELYVATTGGTSAELDGAALDQTWRRVPVPSELGFGEARLSVRAGVAAPAPVAASRLPNYFVRVTTGGGSARKGRADQRASRTPGSLPAERSRSDWPLAVVVPALAVPLLLALGAYALYARRAAAPAKAAAPALATSATPAHSAEPAAAAPSPAAAPPVERDPPVVSPAFGLPSPSAAGFGDVAPAAPLLESPTPNAGVPAPARAYAQNVADRPIPRTGSDAWTVSAEWLEHHERLRAARDRDKAELVFLGDSITEAWRTAPAWSAEFGRYTPLDLGVAGDHTQHLLWRIEHGELDGLHPELAVVLIGVNNLAGGFTPEQTAGGVRAVLAAVNRHLPDTRVLLLGVLPARHEPGDPLRQKISEANHLLAVLASPPRVEFHDVGSTLLEPDGTLAKTTARDFLHPSASGYERLSAAVAPLLEAMRANRGR